MAGSQLAIKDGYVYLFGGKVNRNIIRASLNNPTEWEDTNYDLPMELSNSQIAIINGDGYLFGGREYDGYDGYDSDTILGSSDLLHWNKVGTLPIPLSYSQLAILDGYIYLFGGKSSRTTEKILRAHVSNPLSWSEFGNIVIPIHNSTIGIIDGYVLLIGGQDEFNQRMNWVLNSPVNDLINWSVDSLPNYLCAGQFITIGDDGYVFAMTDASNSYTTNILQYHAGSWFNTQKIIPGDISESQIAIIGDRLFFFGGNGSSMIFAGIPEYKYLETDAIVASYAQRTRTDFRAATLLNRFEVLGFAPWKTNYS
jgi:N-acetylneuraminic acid mutarotase